MSNRLYEVLQKLNISYEEIEHHPAFTVSDLEDVKGRINGVGCKNLFLTDRKDKYFLIVIKDDKMANIQEIAKLVNVSHLSFASESDLKEILGLEKGSVTPFGIINDKYNRVVLVIDNILKNNKVLFHPNVNNKTLSIDFSDLIKFIEYENHQYIYMNLNND